MAWSWDNNAWKEGWQNIWGGQNNQGAFGQDGFFGQPSQPSKLEFYNQHFGDMALTEEGRLDVEGYMDANSNFDMKLLLNNMQSDDVEVRNKALTDVMFADMKYEGEASKQSGFSNVMNNPAFVMGLNLMAQAGSGKQIGEALAPSLTATQAFMTNQELRQQNKKLSRTRDGNFIEQMASYRTAYAQADITESKAEMIDMDLNNYGSLLADNERMRKLNITEKEITNYVSYNTKENKIEMAQGQVTLMGQDIIKNNLSIDQAEVLLETLGESEANKILLQLAQLDNMGVEKIGMIKDNLAKNIENQVNTLNLDIAKDKNNRNKKWIEYVEGLDVSNPNKVAMIEGGPTAYFAHLDKESVDNYRDDYQSYASSVETSLLHNVTTTGEARSAEINKIEDAVISAAVKNAEANHRSKPNQEDFEVAEEAVFSAHGIVENGFLDQVITGGAEFQIESPLPGEIWDKSKEYSEKTWNFISSFFPTESKAMGGAVQAGQPYTVGEQGPETFVPRQDGNIVSNPRTKGGYTWEEAIIDSSEMLTKIKNASGMEEAKKALRKFRPDLYV